MTRLGIRELPGTPDVRRYVGVCMTCRHWQVDVRPGAVSDFGGARPALIAMFEEHAAHLDDCPGAGGRVQYAPGQWVEPPTMSDGKNASGTVEFLPLPRWWVTR